MTNQRPHTLAAFPSASRRDLIKTDIKQMCAQTEVRRAFRTLAKNVDFKLFKLYPEKTVRLKLSPCGGTFRLCFRVEQEVAAMLIGTNYL